MATCSPRASTVIKLIVEAGNLLIAKTETTLDESVDGQRRFKRKEHILTLVSREDSEVNDLGCPYNTELAL